MISEIIETRIHHVTSPLKISRSRRLKYGRNPLDRCSKTVLVGRPKQLFWSGRSTYIYNICTDHRMNREGEKENLIRGWAGMSINGPAGALPSSWQPMASNDVKWTMHPMRAVIIMTGTYLIVAIFLLAANESRKCTNEILSNDMRQTMHPMRRSVTIVL